MSSVPIYLDFNATTPVAPGVLEAMLPWFSDRFGNPSSKRHSYGWSADEAVEVARERVAGLIGGRADGVVFTSGATEALNLAIRGIAGASIGRGRHLVTVATEHSAVLEPHRTLERAGFEVTVLSVNADGAIDLDELRSSLRDDTILVSVMLANNETGVIHPMAEVYDAVRAKGVPVLSDATQAVGKIPVTMANCDFLTISAHKFYGPKGIGALIRNPNLRRLRLLPHIEGGGQERGLRGGTVNVPGVVGLAKAMELAVNRLEADSAHYSTLRDRLESMLSEASGEDLHIFGAGSPRLPNTSNFAINGVAADRLIAACRDLALSTGSACGSGSGRRSHVIEAMSGHLEEVPTTIRVSIGRSTTTDEIETAAASILAAAEQIRSGATGTDGHRGLVRK